MEKGKKIYKSILTIVVVIICSLFVCNAAEATSGDLPTLSLFKPSISMGGSSEIIGKILGNLRVIGAIMIVVAIAINGFNSILGSASEKAEYQHKLVGVIFAGIFLVASTSIAEWIMAVAATL